MPGYNEERQYVPHGLTPPYDAIGAGRSIAEPGAQIGLQVASVATYSGVHGLRASGLTISRTASAYAGASIRFQLNLKRASQRNTTNH